MKNSCSSASRRRGLALIAAMAAAGSLAVVGAQQPPAGRRTRPRRPVKTRRRQPPRPRATPAAHAGDTRPHRRCRRLPAPTRAIVPVAASSVAAKPDQWLGEYVAMTGVVDASLGRLAFTVDQDKTKSGPTCSSSRIA